MPCVASVRTPWPPNPLQNLSPKLSHAYLQKYVHERCQYMVYLMCEKCMP